jgi:hypothetical protein
MSGALPPLPQYAFMAWCSVKAQGQLYLYLLPLKRSDVCDLKTAWFFKVLYSSGIQPFSPRTPRDTFPLNFVPVGKYLKGDHDPFNCLNTSIKRPNICKVDLLFI